MGGLVLEVRVSVRGYNSNSEESEGGCEWRQSKCLVILLILTGRSGAHLQQWRCLATR